MARRGRGNSLCARTALDTASRVRSINTERASARPHNAPATGQLSKGYKQRVGLADALVHEPDLIILDEPTIGLDPQQMRAVRELIKSLAGSHTVLISTHILPEAEMTCNRMLIMFEGRILAADTPDNLRKLLTSNGQIIAEIAAPLEELKAWLGQMADVEYLDVSPGEGVFHRCALTPREGLDLRPQVYALASERGWILRELTRSRHTLEDIYVRVTRPVTTTPPRREAVARARTRD